MTRHIERLSEIAADYDAVVFDQWGVLHNGSAPYGGAIECLATLPCPAAVLSNSGKRAAPNAARIRDMGFETPFNTVMTSGEALWRDIEGARVPETRFHAVERAAGDAAAWGQGLSIEMTALENAEAILLMGLPDGTNLEAWQPLLEDALTRQLPLYCSNPDRKSPRKDGYVISPGAVAFAYREMGGAVSFYGKPHQPIFDSLAHAMGTSKLLMVGDSLEHDIAGASAAGWDSVLVGGGLYAETFNAAPWQEALTALAPPHAPTFFIGEVQ
ncbi:MAG: TIGR01459 family HAD-type hydrolase [Rhodobacteraceae bacterium]|nr:TIGR01459 family HAD-type hydrolase [Paracoccaceae bacterium]